MAGLRLRWLLPLIPVEVVVVPSDNDNLQSCMTERPYGPTRPEGALSAGAELKWRNTASFPLPPHPLLTPLFPSP